MRRTIALTLSLALLLFALPAGAKDLSGMWGVGFSKGFAPEGSGLSSVAVRYWIDRQLAVEFLGGFRLVDRDDGPDERFYNLGGRFLIKFVEEENLHAYGGGGLAWLRERRSGSSDNGVAAEAFAGVEYFFQGLPNLGFTGEVGLGLTDVGDRTTFGTSGESFVNLGMRYYF
ncbi:MAG: hypothetical protein SCH98_00290 [Deferrisomatales bacterium]|nr:hypothetical protein [Deferrisomatales bacterium]